MDEDGWDLSWLDWDGQRRWWRYGYGRWVGRTEGVDSGFGVSGVGAKRDQVLLDKA